MKQIAKLTVVALGIAALLTVGCGGDSGGSSAKSCETGDQCESALCENGKCAPVPVPTECDPACTGNEECVDGKCVLTLTPPPPPPGCTPPCTGNETCVDGTCVDNTPPPTGCDPPCTADQECKNNQCIDKLPPPLECNPPCAAGQECVNGQCVGEPDESTCRSGLLCMNTCPPGDTGCQAACVGALPLEAQNELQTFLQCAQGSGCTTNACVFDKCWDSVHTCIIAGEGDGTCPDVLPCFNTCAQGDSNCPYDCLANVSKPEAKKYLDLEGCLFDNCGNPQGQLDQTCAQAALSPGGTCEAVALACDPEIATTPEGTPDGTPGGQPTDMQNRFESLPMWYNR